MKLKKIASLALAGVMAVSMLTACQTSSNNNNNNQGTNPPVETSGLSAAVEARLDEDLLDYVTLKDSTELDADLEYAVEYVGVREIVDGFVNVNDLLEDLIQQSVALVGKPVALMNKDDKVRAIRFLNQNGAFLVTKSGDKIAKYFGISKYTLYSYIDTKQQEEKPV